MSLDNALRQELSELVVAYTSGLASDEQLSRLEALLGASDEAMAFYIDSLDTHANLYWYRRQREDDLEGPPQGTERTVEPASTTLASSPWEMDEPLVCPGLPMNASAAKTAAHAAGTAVCVVESGSLAPAESVTPFPVLSLQGTVGYFASGWPVAYLVATVICGLGLLAASWMSVSQPVQVVRQSVPGSSPLGPMPKMPFVGRITGMVDCQWADPNTAVPGPVAVPLGRKYALSSGLMEITYDTGAKVILQGPVTYEVESRRRRLLSLGKLTARVESRESRVESNQTVTKSQSAAHSPLSTLDSPLFAVRTPTATVTDLGTEFGVEVNESGSTVADVFRGAVEVCATSAENGTKNVVRLIENQSACVQVNEDGVGTVSHSKARPEAFVCRLPQPPRRTTVRVYNTGEGLKEGDPDPHWQLVAQSNEANFQPRPAIVVPTVPTWLKNEPDRSHWISALSGFTAVPNGVVYTFRTTFELTGVRPETARLAGWFIVDNHVRAIRLNGHEVVVPKHEHDYLRFSLFHKFTVGQGFVDGTNVLEIDVENGKAAEDVESSLMGLRVTLAASAREK